MVGMREAQERAEHCACGIRGWLHVGCHIHQVVSGKSTKVLSGMSKIAFVFPGQGSQYVGMAKDLVERSAEARDLVARADGILGFALSRICFDGPEYELR